MWQVVRKTLLTLHAQAPDQLENVLLIAVMVAVVHNGDGLLVKTQAAVFASNDKSVVSKALAP